MAGFTGQGVLSKYPTVWLDGARPGNTPSYVGRTTAHPGSVPTPKYTFASKKN